MLSLNLKHGVKPPNDQAGEHRLREAFTIFETSRPCDGGEAAKQSELGKVVR